MPSASPSRAQNILGIPNLAPGVAFRVVCLPDVVEQLRAGNWVKLLDPHQDCASKDMDRAKEEARGDDDKAVCVL